MQLKVKELTQENFKDYGTVIDLPESEPTAVLKGLRCWHHIDRLQTPGEIDIGLLQIEKQDMVFTQIERHFESHEMFSPVHGQGVMIFAPEGDFDPSKLEAFYIDGTKAFTVNIGVWHYPPIPVTDYIRLTMAFPVGIKDDAELLPLGQPVTIEL